MPSYDYRCKGCESDVTLERSMSDESTPLCDKCGSEDISRIWSVSFLIGSGSTPDYGQGNKPSSSAPRKSGCSSCSTHSCSTC